MRLPEDRGNPIDQVIREAMAAGEFDHLEGKGKPLAMGPAGERAAALRLLKNAGFAPEWVELEGSIARERREAASLLESYEARRAELLATLEALRGQFAAGPPAEPRHWWRRLAALARLRAPAPSRRELARQMATTVQALNTARDAALRAALRRMHTVNRMVDRYNLVVPLRGHQMWREDLHRVAGDLAGRYPRAALLAGPDASVPPTLEWMPAALPEEWRQPPPEEDAATCERRRSREEAEALADYRRRHYGAHPQL